MKSSAIVDALEDLIGIDGASRDLVGAIVDALRSKGFDEIDATVLAGQRKAAIVELIERRQSKAENAGLIHKLEIFGVLRTEIGGAGKAHPNDDAKIKKAKQGRRRVEAILHRLRSLSPPEFELFGAALVRSLGASISEKTRQTGDQGIDFVGTTRLGDLLEHPKNIFRLAHDMQIDFIGQAKHYPHRTIQSATVRELVGSLELARSRHFSSEKFKLIEDLSLRSFSPVFALLISTGKISQGARIVAEKSGIIVRSGDQIATYLADLGVGIDSGTGEFAEESFAEWMGE